MEELGKYNENSILHLSHYTSEELFSGNEKSIKLLDKIAKINPEIYKELKKDYKNTLIELNFDFVEYAATLDKMYDIVLESKLSQ